MWPPPLIQSVPATEDQPTDYARVISDLFALSDVFAKYSLEPPKASYDDWEAAEAKIKSWVFDNQLDADPDAVDMIEKVAIKIRNFVIEGEPLSDLLGGTGRPTKERLRNMTNELRIDIRAIVNYLHRKVYRRI